MQEIIDKIKNTQLLVGVAGPGAGKTYTFKQIIESKEYGGKKILILSFINKLITDLEKEFFNYKNVEVRTLHAFANKYLGKVEMVESLDKIISEDHWLMKHIECNFSEKLCTNELSSSKSPEEMSFYKKRKAFYSTGEVKVYSFNSSILAVNLFFNQTPNKIPGYDLVLIDEFQDFNCLEFELINILNTKNKIILVGDDDQSLYGFKHAKPSIIRDLYSKQNQEIFSLDHCRRCTKVIVDATNNLILESKKIGLLIGRINKKFLYPEGENFIKDELSTKNSKIDFLPNLQGNKLFYELDKKIRNEILQSENIKKILVLAPKHYHNTVYFGLINKGFSVVDYELFSSEKTSSFTHKNLISIFDVLSKTKTSNLYLRQILSLYLNEVEIMNILLQDKKIWNCLDVTTKLKIENDIALYKKAKKGKDSFNDKEVVRFNEIFNLKNVLSQMVKGFNKTESQSIEVEIVSAMSSKGLSADLVYYLYVDDKDLFGPDIKITDSKICEFLVGITRAKQKLTLISKKDISPIAVKMLGTNNVNIIKTYD